MQLLAKDKSKRPQTAREVSIAIQKIEESEAKAAAAATAPARQKENIPVAKVLPTEAPARAAVKEDIPVARVLASATATPNGFRKETDSDVRRKSSNRGLINFPIRVHVQFKFQRGSR